MTTKNETKPIVVTLVVPPGFVVGEADALPAYDGAPLELRNPCMVSMLVQRGGVALVAVGFGCDRTTAPARSYWHARPANADETRAHQQFLMSRVGLSGVDIRTS